EVWAEASDGRGRTVVGTLTTPNGYAFTADSLVRVVERVLGGEVPAGARTPSGAHGAEFVLGLDGVTLHGIREGAG
ncbi:MAG TPA: saccharopine dehydrogenase, partial [Candidatus Eisenbacteria bacterium]|nr:saccharopine dehydrogenase [Candidatus Eisenbacteria bacterium]